MEEKNILQNTESIENVADMEMQQTDSLNLGEDIEALFFPYL